MNDSINLLLGRPLSFDRFEVSFLLKVHLFLLLRLQTPVYFWIIE